jgi:hypothetical protein
MAESSEKVREFKWTGKKLRAAELIAANELSFTEIAIYLEITDRTIRKWKLCPEFTDKVKEKKVEIEAGMMRLAIAKKHKRVAGYNDIAQRLEKVIQERSEAAEMQAVPGGKTGLLCHDVKGIGKGDHFQIVDVYSVDTGLLKELRETKKQAAEELGQTGQKLALTDSEGNDEPISDGESRVIIAAVFARLGIAIAAPHSNGTGHGNGHALGGASGSHGHNRLNP